MKKLVYLACPIDRAGTGRYAEVARSVAGALVPRGWVAYCPADAWCVQGGLDPRVSTGIWNVNEEARSQADAMVAVVDHRMVSAGVPVEIALSLKQNKPVLLVDLSEDTLGYGAIMGHFVNVLPRVVVPHVGVELGAVVDDMLHIAGKGSSWSR